MLFALKHARSGLARDKAAGTVFGRPATRDEVQREAERARRYETSYQTIMRARDGVEAT